MKDKPLVSVIIPAYNVEKYLATAVGSVLNQTYDFLEVIIVDDGSTDNSLQVARSFSARNVFVFSQPNRGAAAARNFGFQKSTGDLIKFFDADDILSENMLELQVSKLSKNSKSIASASWGRFYNDDLNTFNLNCEQHGSMDSVGWISTSWRNGEPMTQPGMFLIPRSLIEKAGLWDERLSLNDDMEFYTKIILSAEQVLFCKAAKLFYRSGLGDDALSGQKSRKAAESCLLSISLSVERLLSVRNDTLTRLCGANIFQNFIYDFYTLYPDLSKKAEKKVKELGGADYPFPAGGITKTLTQLFGWKVAKRIKSIFE